jgi:protease-4
MNSSCRCPIRRVAWWFICALGVALAVPAAAQSDGETVTRGFDYPNPSVTTVDDLTAVEVNPAGLGLIQGGEFAYGLGLGMPRDQNSLTTDHTLMGAAGNGSIGAGLALQWLRDDIGGRSIRYHKHSFGIGLSPAPIMSLGTSFHFFGSPESQLLNDLTTWDIGLQFRPTSFLGAGITARRINQPFINSFDSLPLALQPGVALRLFDGRAVLDGAVDWTPRNGDVSIHPRVQFEPVRGLELFARADLPVHDDQPRLDGLGISGGVAINMGYAGIRSSVQSRELDRSMQVTGQSHLIRATSQRESSVIPYGGRWIRVDIDGSLGERSSRPLFGATRRSLLDIHQTFADIESDAEIDGILLDITPNDLGYAQAWELRQSIERLREAGKKVVALLQSPDTTNSYLAAAADRTWLIPSEPYEPAGISTNRSHYASLLRKIGVRAEFIRIGAYKSAPESFVRSESSDKSIEQTNAYLDAIFSSVVQGLSDSLGHSADTIRQMIDAVPVLPDRAVDEGYVDDVVYPDEVRASLEQSFGPISAVDDQHVTASTGSEYWGSPLEVAVIYIDGSIVRGESGTAPLIGQTVSGHKTIRRIVDRLLSAPDVRAAVLRIDSPGGSAVASDLMYRQIRRLATQMPVVASMGDVAASGGYYVAAGADEIYATPNTLTGSIGIFAGKFSISTLAERIGINTRQFQRGETAGKYSPFEPWTEQERDAVTTSMNYLYQLFLEQAARTRPIGPDEIDRVARGRVWAGRAAADRKLVDHVGSLMDAIDRAEQLAGLEPGHARYRSYPTGSSFPDLTGGLLAALTNGHDHRADSRLSRTAGAELLNRLEQAVLLPLLYGQKEPLMLPFRPIRLD